MKPISIMDTSISEYNLGNQIIMESVYNQIDTIFPDRFIFKLPYMEINKHTIEIIQRCDYCFFGGTNSLCAELDKYSQWGITKYNYKKIKNFALLGLGWWQYQEKINNFTSKILKSLLGNNILHSVRDNYTEQKLKSIGLHNVINTGCPTIWELTDYEIKNNLSDSVVFSVTDYNQKPKRDKKWLSVLRNRYKHFYLWVQGENDLKYFKQNDFIKDVKIIQPRLANLNNLLNNENADYIGTRLHAGIKALQKKKRAYIIGIDNRSLEMQKDFNIPVIPESEFHNLELLLNSNFNAKINVPRENINAWKMQFKNANMP